MTIKSKSKKISYNENNHLFYRNYPRNYSLFQQHPLNKPLPRIYRIGNWHVKFTRNGATKCCDILYFEIMFWNNLSLIIGIETIKISLIPLVRQLKTEFRINKLIFQDFKLLVFSFYFYFMVSQHIWNSNMVFWLHWHFRMETSNMFILPRVDNNDPKEQSLTKMWTLHSNFILYRNAEFVWYFVTALWKLI